jgi:hypothetical protein
LREGDRVTVVLSPYDLTRGRVTVSVPPEANVLVIECTSTTPEGARRCAQAVATSYVTYRNRRPAPATPSPLRASILSPARLPTQPAGPPLSTVLALAAVAGLGLGVAVAFARDLTGDRLRGRGDLAAQSGLSVVAAIPRVRRTGRFWGAVRPRAEAVVREAPDSAAAEAFRFLRSRVEAACGGNVAGKVLLVTSPDGGAGRTTVAVNLAGALARAGAQVVIVDGDLSAPRLRELLGGKRPVGLANVLQGLKG